MSELIELEYPIELYEHYHKLSDLPGFVLLQSTDRTRGRYDIISAYPYDTIVIKDPNIKQSELQDYLKERLTQRKTSWDLPFQGGAIGYISYDLGAVLSGIHSPVQPTLQDLPLLDLGLYDWAIIVDHLLKKVTFFAANTHPSTAQITREILSCWSETCHKIRCVKAGPFNPLISKLSYQMSFDAIHEALRQGRSYQVNFSQPFHAPYEGDSWELYKKISIQNPVPFAAFLRMHSADILSFSPERFIKYNAGTLLTSPIKGTIHRSNHPVRDEELKRQLLTCSKNRAENTMIVDLLRNDLGKIAYPGSVTVTNLCGIQSYNGLHHLVSDIEGICLNNLHSIEAFLSCFPGGSITGAPKYESMKIISEQERYARGIYCGSIGYFSNHGAFETNIAIRTITACHSILHLNAGGGIVIDSECEEEYQECFTKIGAIMRGI